MKRENFQKRNPARRCVVAVLGLLLLAAPALPQCDPDGNGYVYLHPAFTGRNWGKAAYDSVSISIPDSLCGALKPAQYDICGPAAGATAMFTTATNDLYLMQTHYDCPTPKPPCTNCFLDYLDPVKVTLTGITLASNSPVYLVKSPAYGGDTVKLLLKTSQKNVLAVSLSTATLAALHVDTLKPSGLLAGQEVLAIQGAHDSTAQKDTAVWLLGSNGLLRYFRINAGAWTETNYDLGAGVTDTVLCVSNGFAGTSTGSIYGKLGAKYIFNSQPVSQAITYISSRGAVGRKGTFIDRNGAAWTLHTIGTANYRMANFINRWDGFGVELLDNQWNRTAATFRLNPSSIASTVPTALIDSVNKGAFSFAGSDNSNYTVQLKDTDGSYTDVAINLSTGGSTYNLKTDGKYTIGSLPPDSQCMVDSLLLKSGAVNLVLGQSSVQVFASCELGKRDLSCPEFKCMMVDYAFVANHGWQRGDVLTIAAGTQKLKIVNEANVTVTTTGPVFSRDGRGSITCKLVGNALVFFVRQAPSCNLSRIVLYNVAGRTLSTLEVGNHSSLAAPGIGSAGVVYAKYFFSDGSSQYRSILLVR
jgi:hypothetical protein